MEARFINAKDVDGARQKIFSILRKEYKGDKSVIYYDGWSGLGASAVLRSIAEVLPSMTTIPELLFDRIIHIDCSEWKGRRAMQRAIAEEMELDSSVMAILAKQDEEDDFNGVEESTRNEVAGVSRKINQILKDCRLVLIFHNGSDDDIDLSRCGVPSFDQFFIWTFRRRLLTMKDHQELQGKLRYTHLLVYDETTYLGSSDQFYALLCEEAAVIVARYPCMRGIINPAMVADCCLYQLFLHYSCHNSTKFDWAAHASNLWICDGIMQEDTAREITNALYREITWDMQTIAPETSSLFLAFEGPDPPLAIPIGFFGHSSNLGVLILSCCAFYFASPPFLQCHRLRFLGLHRCKDSNTREGEGHTEWARLNSLWVLDLRYTDWDEILSEEKMDLMTNLWELNIEGVRCWQYTSQLQGRVPCLHRLRIIKPTCGPEKSKDTSNSFLDKAKLEILDLSGNSEMDILPNSLSKASSLQVLVLDGCNGLKHVVPDGLPHLLRSFSFDGYGPASHWTPNIELPLKNFRPSTADNKDVKISKISVHLW